MRLAATLALLPLIGAAPEPTDITLAAACSLGQAATEAAFRALPLTGTEDDTEANERGTIFSFGDAAVYGAPADSVRLFDYAIPSDQEFTQRYEVSRAGDYTAARGMLMSMHSKAQCDREIGSTGSRSCEFVLAPDGQWKRAVTISESGGKLVLVCVFAKSG